MVPDALSRKPETNIVVQLTQ